MSKGMLTRFIPQSVKDAPTLRNKLYELFLAQSTDSFLQFFRYLFVGGAAFIADTAVLLLVSVFTDISFIYVSAGFVFGVAVNFALSKLMVFQQKQEHPVIEFGVVLVISTVGLWLTYILFDFFMLIFSAFMNEYVAKLVSKIISAAIVLIWNFCARKLFYYFINRRKTK